MNIPASFAVTLHLYPLQFFFFFKKEIFTLFSLLFYISDTELKVMFFFFNQITMFLKSSQINKSGKLHLASNFSKKLIKSLLLLVIKNLLAL